MTGWRVGWSVAPAHITKEINKLQSQSVTNVTSFVQIAGVEALKGPQDSVREMIVELRARRDLVYDMVSEIPTLHCPKPKGAFYMFPSYDQKISSERMAEFLLKEAHVAITPGSAFGPAGEGHIRISYAASRQNLIDGMRNIKEALEKL
jgi:aspartate aminotransferase